MKRELDGWKRLRVTKDAYGNPIAFNPATALTTLLYSGEPFDQQTAMQYLRARYYNPATGTFNRLDPFAGNMQDPQSLHKYLYVHGDPISGIDPSGLFTLGAALSGLSGFKTALKSLSVGEFGGDSPALNPAQMAGTVDELIEAITLSKQVTHESLLNAFTVGKGLAAIAARYAFAMWHVMWDYVAFDDPSKLAFAWIGARACFAAGTKIVARMGEEGEYVTESIEDLAEGDMILTRDQSDVANAVSSGQVTRVFQKESDHLRILTIRNGAEPTTLRTTDDHPFWRLGRGWTRAADLVAGDRLAGLDGATPSVVVSSRRESYPGGIAVYNLEVAGTHSYFVSDGLLRTDSALWVHNMCLFESIQDQFGRIGKVLALVNPVDIMTGSHANNAARTMVKAVGQALDDAGHLIGRRLGGSGSDLTNIVAQNRRVNRGVFNVFEGDIARYILDNKVEALLEVIPKYIGNAKRPHAIEYIVEFSDGVTWAPRVFPNP